MRRAEAKAVIKGMGKLDILEEPLSIFDEVCAGQIAEDGKYYTVLSAHNEHKLYAIPVEKFQEFFNTHCESLDYGVIRRCEGEFVRGMTFKEEDAWNRDELHAVMDLWGNMRVEVNDLAYGTVCQLMNPDEVIVTKCNETHEFVQSLLRSKAITTSDLVQSKKSFQTPIVISGIETRGIVGILESLKTKHGVFRLTIKCIVKEDE